MPSLPVQEEAEVSPMTQVAKLKQKARKKVQSRLSFGGDDNEVSLSGMLSGFNILLS